MLTSVLNRARHADKGNWTTYGEYKKLISAIPLSSEEHEKAVKRLTKILKV